MLPETWLIGRLFGPVGHVANLPRPPRQTLGAQFPPSTQPSKTALTREICRQTAGPFRSASLEPGAFRIGEREWRAQKITASFLSGKAARIRAARLAPGTCRPFTPDPSHWQE